tara:strand:- start:166 stop:714 length:549 start_codon:yes stop_codon:yes gene_type:complete
MLEQALLEIRLPAGIVDSDNIVAGSITPQNCKLDADWDFTGSNAENPMLGGYGIASSRTARNNNGVATQNRQVSTSSYGSSSSSSSTSMDTPQQVEDVDSEEEVIYLDALRRKVIYTLPAVAKSKGRKMYIKRIDKDPNNICRVVTRKDDKVDGTDGIVLTEGQAVILIASSEQWHVFAKLN